MNNLFIAVFIEGIALIVVSLLALVHEISTTYPQLFAHLPKLSMPTFKAPNFKADSFFGKLQADARLVWNKTEPEFFASPDGNTLYLSAKLTNDWKPEQVILFMLSHKQEFLDQLKAKDPAVFDAIEALSTKLSTAQISVNFQNMNVLPSFTKVVLAWKLPLIDMPEVNLAKDIIVKELGSK